MDERFDAMYRLMIRGGIVLIAALLGVIATFSGVLATQL